MRGEDKKGWCGFGCDRKRRKKSLFAFVPEDDDGDDEGVTFGVVFAVAMGAVVVSVATVVAVVSIVAVVVVSAVVVAVNSVGVSVTLIIMKRMPSCSADDCWILGGRNEREEMREERRGEREK